MIGLISKLSKNQLVPNQHLQSSLTQQISVYLSKPACEFESVKGPTAIHAWMILPSTKLILLTFIYF